MYSRCRIKRKKQPGKKDAKTKFQTNRNGDWATKCAVTLRALSFNSFFLCLVPDYSIKRSYTFTCQKIQQQKHIFIKFLLYVDLCPGYTDTQSLPLECFPKNFFRKVFLKRERCFNSLIWFFFYWKAWGRNSDINGWEALIIPFNWEEPKPTIRSIANIRIPAHYLMTCIWPQTQESLEIDCWKSPEETFLQWGATRDTSLGVIVIRRVYKELQYSHEL